MKVTEKDHWDKIFAANESNHFSWFQAYPKKSVAFLELFNLPFHAHIIDIGGGDSNLVDVLLEKGYYNVSILDISANALERAKKRLGEKADSVSWIVSDINDFKSTDKFDFWHDRAAFHFLTSEVKIKHYVKLAEKNISPNGYLILGTFSENGPEKCSGLSIKQYSETSMTDCFNKAFKRVKCVHEEHQTPFETSQDFLFCSFQKK
jgi:2-polyprenyl-3-methyl-5-hydroxy-6-metoxy-1,4-benzoquinol methylase